MPKLMVRFGDQRDYPIIIQPGIIKNIGPQIKARVRGKQAFVISHPRIKRLYGQPVEKSLMASGFQPKTILVPEGEQSKSLARLESLTGQLIKARADRSAFIVALGGGVIGDLAGFLASVYMRGIDFVQIPTTLLAQIDSSVGGKVAVNHELGKNLIGAFLQPRLVITDPMVLQSLPLRQLKSGLAEMIKSAIIADEAFFKALQGKIDDLLKLNSATLAWAIKNTCAIKAKVVEKDEKEHGLRAILNYGHTVGHALETYHHYQRLLHGEAVAIGMAAAAQLAVELGMLKPGARDAQIRLIKQAGLPIMGYHEDINNIITIMKTDKKTSAGEFTFVLTPQIGRARICKKITPFPVRRVLKAVLGSA